MKTLLTRITAAALLSAIVIIGCKKENSSSASLTPQEEQDVASVSSQSETETEFAFNDVFNNVMGTNDSVGMAGVGVFGRISSGNYNPGSGRGNGIDSTHCFIVTVVRTSTSSYFPIKITIDFGTSGCLGHDGHMRYGKIITTYSGRLTEPGKYAETVFDGYKIDSISITGTHKITNTSNSTTSSNQRQFTVDVTGAKLSKPSGNYESWESHRVITQTDGNGTPYWPLDDVFSITGSASGKVKNGSHLYAWHSEITSPLIKKFTCPWVVKGVLKVWRESLSSTSQWAAVLDYGTGDCDNKATLTINGVSHQITLH